MPFLLDPEPEPKPDPLPNPFPVVLAKPYPTPNPLLKTETTVPLIFCEAKPVPLLRPTAPAVPLPTD